MTHVTPIPFCDLRRAIQPIRVDIDAAVQRVIDSGWYLRGHEVAAFEEEWAAYCGQAHCVSCNSGTDALTLSGMALGLKTARIQANTLPLTAVGLDRGGASIMLCEIGDDGRPAVVDNTTVPVLLYGRRPSVGEENAILFDAAHAHGWQPPQQATACWSFYPTKSLGALGDAGGVTTNDANLAAEMRDLRGQDDRFYQKRQITSRMDEMQAAVLRVKLRHLDRWIAERREIAAHYCAQLPAGIVPITSSPDDFHHLFVVQHSSRDALAAHLQATANAATKVHFHPALNTNKQSWLAEAAGFPKAEKWCDTVLTLPCYPGLTLDEVDRICEAAASFSD